MSKLKPGEREAMREWVEFKRHDGWTMRFDVTFLLSPYHCIYGQGCKGVEGKAEFGCCNHGAYMDDLDDVTNVNVKAHLLTAEEWELRKVGLSKGVMARVGHQTKTRVVDGACIFHNRKEPGCALHKAALLRGENYIDWKPNVCWQVPFSMVEDEDENMITLRAMENGDWNFDGDEPVLQWWCIDAGSAFTGAQPVYVSMREELSRMINDEAIMAELIQYLDQRFTSNPYWLNRRIQMREAEQRNQVMVELRTSNSATPT